MARIHDKLCVGNMESKPMRLTVMAGAAQYVYGIEPNDVLDVRIYYKPGERRNSATPWLVCYEGGFVIPARMEAEVDQVTVWSKLSGFVKPGHNAHLVPPLGPTKPKLYAPQMRALTL